MKKRILSLLLCVAMLLTLLPQTVLFASADDSGTCGTNLSWSYNSSTYTLTITGSGAMNDWPWGSEVPWYSYCSSIKSVSLPDGLTSIGYVAFYGCTGLTAISIPDSVTSIGWSAFEGCTGLTSITIPSGVTAISDYAFSGCTGLTSITIGNGVTSIGYRAFYNCTGLTAITIPDSVTSIGDSAFSGCTGLTSITVAEGNSFYDSRNNCNAIIETATNTLIAGCKNTVIPDSVTSIGEYAFLGCTGLTAISIPDSVTAISDDAFEDCTGLTSITIPDSVTSIGGSAFNHCTGLTSITIPSGVTSIGGSAFNGCTGLTAIAIPDSVTAISDGVFAGCTGLTAIAIPDSVTSIGDWAFGYCSGLTSVTIGNSVTSIGEYAFCDCTGLTSVTIPDSVTSIGEGAFYGCSSLTSVYFCGDAPELDVDVFVLWDELKEENIAIPGLTLYYIEGKTGWTTPTWNGYPTATWKPETHEHSYTETVTAPTCTEKGYTTHTCACGDSYKDTYVDALGHNYVNGVCSRCGENDPNYVPPVDPCEGYTDIDRGSWYHSAADFVISRGLMGSTQTDALTFEPNTKVSRAMVASILYRMEESPAVEYKGTFTDVPDGKWYTTAIEWCAQNGLASGKGDGTFDPMGDVTRQELAVFMMKMAEYLGKDTSGRADFGSFADGTSVPSWAKEYVQWAVSAGLISGKANGGKTYLAPTDTATRAEFASIIMRFVQNIAEAK